MRLHAIQKLKSPKTSKDCKLFAGVVNYLSMVCPNLPKLPKLIYDLTMKGRLFIWAKMLQEAFEKINVIVVLLILGMHSVTCMLNLHMYGVTNKHHAYSLLELTTIVYISVCTYCRYRLIICTQQWICIQTLTSGIFNKTRYTSCCQECKVSNRPM